jgi:hypothetical protein
MPGGSDSFKLPQPMVEVRLVSSFSAVLKKNLDLVDDFR